MLVDVSGFRKPYFLPEEVKRSNVFYLKLFGSLTLPTKRCIVLRLFV